MSYNTHPPQRALPSHLRSASLSANPQSSALAQRISEKKTELANLQELKSLSAGLADQMALLESKLSTLSDGTEAVAVVLANWHSVLRAIGMASGALPKPKDEETSEGGEKEVPLPQTLVRIPTQNAGALIPQSTSGSAAD